MRFLTIFNSVERDAPPSQEEMEAMGRLMADMGSAGVLLAADGCMPSRLGARVRREGGKTTVTDGPFSESKEIVGGFAILECRSREEAVELTKRFLDVAGDGVSEIRQLYDVPAFTAAE